ncbi:thiazole biosynthesis adenylyltransferase ThiF [Legionella lansingensis]|uniref:Molybdopterin-synthase adenylyltransferase n=1 Tax=Legionella lansingensis TaxID=45067 RepID=A0A0W0VN04_9GAMM|nr:HesA/MoeB/ThiF family protein [Legionella lansingensis]KTD21427.1 thiazole biosynthesis adenylyltransferase ThiF [Legionella lansingensis]SNV51981.1 thiazole biosynthesis adenylyltransferase ThiF [Legionella lansingensis]
MLTPEELLRYDQQIKLPQIGVAGQRRLKQARVLCIGAGGLGSPLLLYLAGAGVGKLGIVDPDQVEMGNLHRQLLYQSTHIKQSKAIMAKKQLEALNPTIDIQAYDFRFTAENAKALIQQYDIVADCCDNFATRYLAHEICLQLEKPYVFASAVQFRGYCSIFYGKNSPCLQCLFPRDLHGLPNCQESGVLGVVPGILGLVQATEVLKWILGNGQPLHKRLLVIDVLGMNFQDIQLTQDPDCNLCFPGINHNASAQNAITLSDYAVSSQRLSSFLKSHTDLLLLDVRTVREHNQQNLGGKLIPLCELNARMKELNAKQNILVYCQSGPRSEHALNLLIKAGFQNVHYLKGGIMDLPQTFWERWSPP